MAKMTNGDKLSLYWLLGCIAFASAFALVVTAVR
jgi:hypothetical protein